MTPFSWHAGTTTGTLNDLTLLMTLIDLDYPTSLPVYWPPRIGYYQTSHYCQFGDQTPLHYYLVLIEDPLVTPGYTCVTTPQPCLVIVLPLLFDPIVVGGDCYAVTFCPTDPSVPSCGIVDTRCWLLIVIIVYWFPLLTWVGIWQWLYTHLDIVSAWWFSIPHYCLVIPISHPPTVDCVTLFIVGNSSLLLVVCAYCGPDGRTWLPPTQATLPDILIITVDLDYLFWCYSQLVCVGIVVTFIYYYWVYSICSWTQLTLLFPLPSWPRLFYWCWLVVDIVIVMVVYSPFIPHTLLVDYPPIPHVTSDPFPDDQTALWLIDDGDALWLLNGVDWRHLVDIAITVWLLIDQPWLYSQTQFQCLLVSQTPIYYRQAFCCHWPYCYYTTDLVDYPYEWPDSQCIPFPLLVLEGLLLLGPCWRLWWWLDSWFWF